MLENAGLLARDQQKSNSQHVNATHARFLLDELRQWNIGSSLASDNNLLFAGGVPHRVSVRNVLNSQFEAERLKLALRHFIRNDVPVTLSLTELDGQAPATTSLQQFCEYLRKVLSPVGFLSSKLGLCLHSHQMPLQAFVLISNSILGTGPRFVYLDGLQMRHHCNENVQSETMSNWRFLWQQRRIPGRILPVYGGLVRSACPLLSDEIAGAVLPGTVTVVPHSSAWLPLELSLPDFLDDGGQINWTLLSKTIEKTVRVSEQLFNHLSWPCWRLRTDARLHRRLALSINGIGEVVVRSGRAPASLDCLTWLVSIIRRIRAELVAISADLAQEAGALPAVLRTDPSTGLKAGPARDSWRRHWESAIHSSALRHRNLLVLSPYSVVPDNTDRSIDYSDLLPVISEADAWCFSTTSSFSDWSINDYQRFHRRAWAVIQGHNEGCVVAAGV